MIGAAVFLWRDVVEFHEFSFQHPSTAAADDAVYRALRLRQDIDHPSVRDFFPSLHWPPDSQLQRRRGDFVIISANRRFGLIMDFWQRDVMLLVVKPQDRIAD